jgi:RHS repeat-associated protein
MEHTGDPAPTASATAAGARSAVLCARRRAPMSLSWACLPEADPLKVPIDPNGNLTTKTEGSDTWTYTWNAENQLNKVEKNGVEVARFSYDALDRRVEKVAGGVTTSYTYDNENILREARGASTFRYVHALGIDEPLAREDGSGARTYYHADGLSSIVKRTSQVGAAIHEYRYDAWGNIEMGAAEPGVSFTGREWDPETELYYYRRRFYDPGTGTFLSEDPIKPSRGSLYPYVDNNPVGFVDPFGLQAWSSHWNDWKVLPSTGFYTCCYKEKISICRGPAYGGLTSVKSKKCALDHENLHLPTFRNDCRYKNYCDGKPDGYPVTYMDEGHMNTSECEAWKETKECLQGTWSDHPEKMIRKYCGTGPR